MTTTDANPALSHGAPIVAYRTYGAHDFVGDLRHDGGFGLGPCPETGVAGGSRGRRIFDITPP
ncbi:MAG: hypothetical protein ABSG83_16860 [Roseiarcus sp.]